MYKKIAVFAVIFIIVFSLISFMRNNDKKGDGNDVGQNTLQQNNTESGYKNDNNQVVSESTYDEKDLPVSLFKQNVFFGSLQEWAPYCSSVTDIEGNTYSSARRLNHTDNYTSLSSYKIVFTLNNEFSMLCGKIVLPKGELDKNYSASNWLEFRDDNDNVIGVSPSCNSSSPSVEFSIDVSGVKNLTIIGRRDTFLNSGHTYVVGDFELYR